MDFLFRLFHFWNYSNTIWYSRNQYRTLTTPYSTVVLESVRTAQVALSVSSYLLFLQACQNYWKVDTSSPVSPGRKGQLRTLTTVEAKWFTTSFHCIYRDGSRHTKMCAAAISRECQSLTQVKFCIVCILV